MPTGGTAPGYRPPTRKTKPRKPKRTGGTPAPRPRAAPRKQERPRARLIRKAKPRPKPKSRRRTPYDPLQPLTGRSFRREVDRLAELEYGGQERQLASERRISNQATVNTGNWYDRYLQDLEAARVRTQQGYQQAQGAVTAQANLAAGQDERQSQALAAEAQRSAALRGATAAPDVAGQQAAQARRALSGSFAGYLGAQGAAQNTFGASRGAAGSAARVRALEDESARGRQISKAAPDLKREKGAYKVKARGELREGERTYALNRSAFNLDVAEEQEQQRANRARERENRKSRQALERDRSHDRMMQDKKFQLDRQKFGADQAKERYQRRHGLGSYRPPSGSSGGGGGPTRTQTINAREDVGAARTLLRKKKVAGENAGQALDALVLEENIPRPLARAALQLHLYGGVDRKLARAVKRDYGIKLKVRKPRKVDRPSQNRPG